MEIHPLSEKAQNAIALPIVVLCAPVWAPLVGFIWLVVKAEKALVAIFDPPGWRKVFAWWPVDCDPWPDRGFNGWVWLEIVWRNPHAPGWTKYRREAPSPTQHEG